MADKWRLWGLIDHIRKGHTLPKRTIITKNTYEIAWYLMNGATIKEARKRRNRESVVAKTGRLYTWEAVVNDIPEKAVTEWKYSTAEGPIRQIEGYRRKIKRMFL